MKRLAIVEKALFCYPLDFICSDLGVLLLAPFELLELEELEPGELLLLLDSASQLSSA